MDVTDTRTILINDDVPDLPAIAERMATTTARLEADFSKVESKIHRFPGSLRGIGGDNDRYIVPSVVAIGPYHHGAPHLHKMEEVKLAAAYYLCGASGRSTAEVYEKYMVAGGDVEHDATALVLQNRMTLSTGPSIQKDIFLLENQIPWLVLDALAEFMFVDVGGFVTGMGDKFLPFPRKARKPEDGRCCRRGMRCGCIPTALAKTTRPSDEESRGVVGSTEQHKPPPPPPPHLLGLLRFTQVGCMPDNKKNYTGVSSSWSSSAVELAEMGVVLTPRTEVWFGDMSLRRRCLYGELSLSPVFLSDVTACWLVNMAALEASTAGAARDTDGFVVSSYLSVLAMLMDRKEDVHELRRRGLVHGALSNKQALGFFKGLGQHLRFGRRYFTALEEIDSYKRHRSVRIKAYKFVYNYCKFIAAFLSVTGVLIGIFKTLLSLKRHC
ncbi:unnamed protein product [Miscanthus lutarioriparius]|uniref:Uncharacterized protein n=1 Tax=Miscanthus lutarioriparius TaxID=422564 RepID=A0A811SKN2_9POAL|nr:unnamed protein product [Miscanthus lutarioriparius]